ncbi:MAG: hypothetical protein O7J95_18660 [Planctomycetota bacterium]|nr:hypothetical protein [Planctomycetota bacterium]
MLDTVEKICAYFCGFVVLCVGALYLYFGTGSSMPLEFLEPVVITPFPDQIPAAPVNRGAPAPENPSRVSDPELRKKLSRQIGVRLGGPVPKKQVKVPVQTFEYLQNEANWMRQLDMARSFTEKNPQGEHTRLRIDGIKPNSLWKKLGFQDNDVIELIDGDILEYRDDLTLQYHKRAREALEKLRSGGTVTVTVSRNRKPEQLIFSLQDLR